MKIVRRTFLSMTLRGVVVLLGISLPSCMSGTATPMYGASVMYGPPTVGMYGPPPDSKRLSGRVVAKADGSGLGGIHVTLLDSKANALGDATTDADGQYAIVVSDTSLVVAIACHDTQAAIHGGAYADKTVQAQPSATGELPNVELEKA